MPIAKVASDDSPESSRPPEICARCSVELETRFLMKILLVHDFYQNPGGEDRVYRSEGDLLERHGHDVVRYLEHNLRVPNIGRIRLAFRTVWSRESHSAVRELVRSEKPDVAHVHNTLPLISPAVYYAIRDGGVPVVQTIHNYRPLCLPGEFLRDGRICEDCLGKNVPWPGVLHACYRGSRSASATVASMVSLHRAMGTYTKAVDMYIALTEFGRDKFIEGGIPAEKIVIKPNFVDPDPGVGGGAGGYALFVGRLSEAKGVRTLLRAWERLDRPVPLLVAGDGPLADEALAAARRIPGMRLLGWQSRRKVIELMKNARLLVFPSEWYEGLGLVLIEALATGLPIVTTNLGTMSSIIDDSRTGFHFAPGDPDDLARKVLLAWDHPELERIRAAARAEYESRYTAERNYEILMEIYEACIAARGGPRGAVEREDPSRVR